MWVEHTPRFRIVALFTQGGEETVRPYAESKGLLDVIEVRSAQRSLVELVATQVKFTSIVRDEFGMPASSDTNVYENRVEIDGAPVFVFEFADSATADWVAGGISADGGSITITRLEDGSQVQGHGDCIGTPYLYKKGRLIVILYDHAQAYDSARARSAVRSVLGPHFAGGPWAFLSKDRQ